MRLQLVALFLPTLFFTLFLAVAPGVVSAASLSSVSDTITTSRPSASSPLYVNQSSGSTQATVVDNSSMYLASDSASINPDTGETLANGLNIASMSAQQTLPSPVGWWKFDDGSGTTAVDSSGNGNNGTLEGSTDLPTWETNCVYNGCLGFDGTDDYVLISKRITLGDQISISAWFKVSGGSGGIAANGNTACSSAGNVLLNSNFFYVQTTSCGGISLKYSPVAAAWNYVVAEVNGSKMVVYLNGVEVASRNDVYGFTDLENNVFVIGAQAGPTAFFDGQIDDVRIFSQALTAGQVNMLYTNYLPSPFSPYRIVYFTSSISTSHHAGDPLVVPQTALQTIAFTTQTPVPDSGSIVLTFPSLAIGDANTPASPSASTFQMNGLSPPDILVFSNGTNITSHVTATVTNPSGGGSSPSITLSLDSSTAIAGTTPVVIYLGCTAGTSSSCTTQQPTIINPTKTAAAGTADTWTLQITTQDASGLTLDSAKAKIGTIESVQVQANVDPTLTFTISGITNGNAINTGNTTGCTNTEAANTGISSTATTVNLGTLSSAAININAQLLTVVTNGINGYSLTATSSGHLINPATGFWIPDNGTSPGTFTAGTPQFGIHPCGSDVSNATWAVGTTGGGTGAKYGWPTQTSMVTLASDATGPILGTTATHGITSVEYAGTIDTSVPAGIYTSIITYVVTPTF